MEQKAFNTASNYESGLASGTNEETKREVSRARDQVSVGMQKEGEAAGARGADPSLFTSRALESGKRYIADVQGRMADSALNARLGAVNAVTGAAGQAAGGQRQLQLGTLAAQNAAQQTEDAAAAEQARLNQAPYDRMMQMAASMGGFTGAVNSTAGGGFLGGSVGGVVDPQRHPFSSTQGGYSRS
jgi:hypothetical protein